MDKNKYLYSLGIRLLFISAVSKSELLSIVKDYSENIDITMAHLLTCLFPYIAGLIIVAFTLLISRRMHKKEPLVWTPR